MKVAIVHDYLTQQGGAERVVLAMLRALGDVPVYTSLYDPRGTYPAFADADVRCSALDRIPLLRRSHRFALPLLAPAFSRLRVDADVAVCSSSGWAHGARVSGRKLVYCHAPARWLYQSERYAARGSAAHLAIVALRPALRRWDERAARSAVRYVANSRAVADQVRAIYGIEAAVVPPPSGLTGDGEREPVAGIEPGFVLCVSRLQRHKNVDAVVAALGALPDARLVIAGDGPEAGRLERTAPANVRLVGAVSDAQLRWLYASCAGVVSAAHEDFGLVPLEAASFGRPAAVLRFGGFLDTVEEERTGVFFDRLDPSSIAAALRRLLAGPWDGRTLLAQAARFSEEAFGTRLRALVREVAGATG